MSRLQIGDFEFLFSIYTTDACFYRPRAWARDGNTHVCNELVSGESAGQQPTEEGQISVTVSSEEDGRVRFCAACRADKPIKAIKVKVGLPNMKMLAPECVELEDAVWRQWDFPCHWRTGFAVWQDAQRYFTVSTQEFPWRFKRLRALRTGDQMQLEIVQDASLRERSLNFQTSTWEVGYRADLDDLLESHASFVQQAYGAADFDRRADVPEWARGVGLVVNLHGVDWNGQQHLDYFAMTRAADALAEMFPPAQTILYLIGWDGSYMRGYPDYEPATGLGGQPAFRRFCETAHGHGFHIMPHLNAMAANMCHPLYLRHLKDYVLRDANGVFQHSFKIDWDHDGQGDAAHAYVSLVPPGLREIIVDVIDQLVADFGFEAVFLDETCNVFYNDPAWDQVEGVRRLVRDIRRRRPELLIAGEEWNEMLLGLTPLVQIWEETADGRKGFGREKSPLLRHWAGRFIRSCGYLALASPDGRTGVHEWPDRPWVAERENEAYYLPTLSITRQTLEDGMDGVRATVERAQDYLRCFVERV